MSTCRKWTASRFSVSCGAAARRPRSVPALVITTESGEQDVQEARIAGANFYLVKPVAESELQSYVAVLAGAPR